MGSNCTLLELKPQLYRDLLSSYVFKLYLAGIETLINFNTTSELYCVQIVPCWNWNINIPLFWLNVLTVQIVPCWNWNDKRCNPKSARQSVQIVPCWNWNSENNAKFTNRSGSNCTLLELKLEIVVIGETCTDVQIVPCWNWNYSVMVAQMILVRSNCTLLELKRPKVTPQSHPATVQIVPCWNWNTNLVFLSKVAIEFKLYLAGIETSVKRLHHLRSIAFKLYLAGIETFSVKMTLWHSSRFKLYLAGIETEMELYLFHDKTVQIVPCWNWNFE